jgi:hypothetical protein
MLIENTWGNDKREMRTHLKAISDQFGKIKGLSEDRYTSLRSALNPSIKEILEVCSLLRVAFNEFVSHVQLAIVDEAVVAYQPSKTVKDEADATGEPIPVMYVPRKPHPNGLEVFLVTTPVEHETSSSEHLPYIIDILPHLQKGDNAPTDIVQKFMKHWTTEPKPHILGDSAFGSFSLLEEIIDWGAGGTFAMQGKFAPYLWEVLSANLPPNTWRAAHNDQGWLASCSKIFDVASGKQTYQQILSTAFPLSTTTSLASASSPAAATDTIENTIAHITPSKTTMPVYDRATLEKMTVKELREICSKYNIKKGKNKTHIVDNISMRSATVHQQYGQVESLMKQVQTDSLPIPGPAHDFYRAYFNLIDLADRKWNAVADHHGIWHWRTKMILTILRFAVLNAWTYSTKIRYEPWLEWRLTLACSILGLNKKP